MIDHRKPLKKRIIDELTSPSSSKASPNSSKADIFFHRDEIMALLQQHVGTTTTAAKEDLWFIDQVVEVASRTWPGINRPGGCGRIVKLYRADNGEIMSVDVKYMLYSGTDTNIDTCYIKPFTPENTANRVRRSAVVSYTSPKDDIENKVNRKKSNKKGTGEEKKKTKNASPLKSRINNASDKNDKSDDRMPSTKERTPKSKPKAESEKNVVTDTTKAYSSFDRSHSKPTASITKTKYEKKCDKRKFQNYDENEGYRKVKSKQQKQPRENERRQDVATNVSSNKKSSDKHKRREKGMENVPKEILVTSHHSIDNDLWSPMTEPRNDSEIAISPIQKSKKSVPKRILSSPPKKAPQPEKREVASKAHLTLREVNDRAKDDARRFIDQIVGVERSVRVIEVTKKEPSPDDSQKRKEKRKRKRLSKFTAILVDLFTLEDGEIQEKEIVPTIAKIAEQDEDVRCFSNEEVEEFLTILSDQNKIMRSNGTLYSIF